jgi:hypothetical protein
MKASNIPAPVWYVGGLAVAGVVAYFLIKKGASVAANAVGDAGVGAVKGIGSILGVPDTNMTQCQKDMAAGRTWDASFSCDASTFLSYLVGGSSSAPCTDCANKTGSVPYDYGFGGAGGVPYRDGVNTLPDVFNLSSTNWLI